MNVGDYVRTKDGIIDEVIIKYEGHCNNPECNCKHVSCKYNYYNEEDIIKSSPNIIDLIKEGDCVNGHKVCQIFYQNQTIDNITYLDLEGVNILVCNEDIKSIVTKEQFANIEYKVRD